MSKIASLKLVEEEVKNCTKCKNLLEGRLNTVFGEGDPNARVVLLGEAPGREENEQGRPFVGPAGRLLDNIIRACSWKREDVYILNILRCRPINNSTPTEEEACNCRPYLDRQIEIIDPTYIICLGTTASQNLIGEPISQARGKWHKYKHYKVMATYHPSYLLRTPKAKKLVWEDLQMVLEDMR